MLEAAPAQVKLNEDVLMDHHDDLGEDIPPEIDLTGVEVIEGYIEKEHGNEDDMLLNLKEKTAEEHARSELAYLRQRKMNLMALKDHKQVSLLADMVSNLSPC